MAIDDVMLFVHWDAQIEGPEGVAWGLGRASAVAHSLPRDPCHQPNCYLTSLAVANLH